jgi:hypothetical protein
MASMTAQLPGTVAQSVWLFELSATVGKHGEIEFWIEADGTMGVSLEEDGGMQVCHVDRQGQMVGNWI